MGRPRHSSFDLISHSYVHHVESYLCFEMLFVGKGNLYTPKMYGSINRYKVVENPVQVVCALPPQMIPD